MATLEEPEPTPKSFFFHSPPESPALEAAPATLGAPPNHTHNPLIQLTGSLSSLTHKSTTKSSSRFKKFKSLKTRPSVEPDNGGTARNGWLTKASEEDSYHLDSDPFASDPIPRPSSKVEHIKGQTTGQPSSLPTDGFTDKVLDIRGTQGSPEETHNVNETETSPERAAPISEAVVPPDISSSEPLAPALPTLVLQTRQDASLPPTPNETPASVLFPRNLGQPSLPPKLVKMSMEYNRSNIPGLPTFPSTYAALSPSITRSAAFPRYVPPQSTLSRFLPKSWKPRLTCLSSFPLSAYHFAYFLHIFKLPTTRTDNIEIERMEITEDSMASIIEGNIGGRRNFMRVGGLDVGTEAMKREHVTHHPPNAARAAWITVWFFHIEPPHELQNWLAAVRESISNRKSGAELVFDVPNSDHDQTPSESEIVSEDIEFSPVAQSLPHISPLSPFDIEGGLSLANKAATRSEVTVDAPDMSLQMEGMRSFLSAPTVPTLETLHKSRPQSTILPSRSGKPLPDSPRVDHYVSGIGSSPRSPGFRNSTSIVPSSSQTIRKQPVVSGAEVSAFARQGNERLPTELESEVNGVVVPPETSRLSKLITNDLDVPTAEAPIDPRAEALDALTQRKTPTSAESPDSLPLTNTASPPRSSDPRADSLDALTQRKPPNSRRPGSPPVANTTSSPRNSRSFHDLRRSSSSRVRYSLGLPDMQRPPTGPLPQIPPFSSSNGASSTTPGKRLSSMSNARVYSSDHPSTNRLSILFSRNLSSTSIRSSIPPPPRPPPTFAPPPVPSEENRRISKSFPGLRRVSRSPDSLAIPPPGRAPSGPLPPPPPTPIDDESLSTEPTERLRMNSTPSRPTIQTYGLAPDNAETAKEIARRNRMSFMDDFTPPPSADAYFASSDHNQKTEHEEPPDALPPERQIPPPPPRSSKRPPTRPINRL